MIKINSSSSSYTEHLLAVLVGLVLLFFTYVLFFEQPYLGFQFNHQTGLITSVDRAWVQPPLLIEGDLLLKAGDINFPDYSNNTRQPLITVSKPGDKVSLTILRNGQQQVVEWILPVPASIDILRRFYSLWIPYVFWGFGVAALFFLRPKDMRWRLLIAINFLTAIWLIAGILSVTHLRYSSVILHVCTWFCIPVYWHFHWVFPRPLGRLPTPLLVGVYATGVVLAVLEWSGLMPVRAFYGGFVLAALGSLILLGAHALTRPDQRRDLIPLALVVFCAVLFAIVIGIGGFIGRIHPQGGGAVLFLPLVPAAYFFAVYRQQLGWLELRANRAVAWVLYAALLFGGSVLFVGAINILFVNGHVDDSIAVAAAVLAGLVTALVYPSFRRWVERRLLGMPLQSSKLLEVYPARITTSLETGRLVSLLRDELLPSLLIRQAALLRFSKPAAGDQPSSFTNVFTLGVSADQLPKPDEIPGLIALSGRERLLIQNREDSSFCDWVRLALPLVVEGEMVGLCLLGRRDPDDRYAPTEIPTLQALMDQTALALLNIEQAQRLRVLYQANIGRQEAEHSRMARELHDEVLGQLALLSMSLDEVELSPQFSEAYQSTVRSIRKVISGLRPGMLSYGLRPALDELVDELSSQYGGKYEIEMDVPQSEARYSEEVEQHLYRIVQQACQNALKHAHARHICIHGRLELCQVFLIVEDDGTGFDAGESLDLSSLLASGHFGLAGMNERAEMIGGRLKIDSSPGYGTRVQITLEI